jgi:hypothetical protein
VLERLPTILLHIESVVLAAAAVALYVHVDGPVVALYPTQPKQTHQKRV